MTALVRYLDWVDIVQYFTYRPAMEWTFYHSAWTIDLRHNRQHRLLAAISVNHPVI